MHRGQRSYECDIEWSRLKRLRDTMTQAEIDNLQAAFDDHADALARDEIAVLNLVTRER